MHLRIDGAEVLTMSPEVAAQLSDQARTCLAAALHADPTARAAGWAREALTAEKRVMTVAEFEQLTTGRGPVSG